MIRRTLLLATALAIGISAPSLLAQDAPPPAAKAHRGMPTPAERLQHMTEVHGLTADQQQKIGAILESEAAAAKAVWSDESLARDQRREKMQAIRKDTRDKIHALLTPEQVAKFKDAMREGPHGKGKGPKQGS